MSDQSDNTGWTVNWPVLGVLLAVIVVIGFLLSWIAAAAAAVLLAGLLLLNRIGTGTGSSGPTR